MYSRYKVLSVGAEVYTHVARCLSSIYVMRCKYQNGKAANVSMGCNRFRNQHCIPVKMIENGRPHAWSLEFSQHLRIGCLPSRSIPSPFPPPFHPSVSIPFSKRLDHRARNFFFPFSHSFPIFLPISPSILLFSFQPSSLPLTMSDRGSTCKFRKALRALRNLHVDPLSLHTSMRNKQIEINP